MNARMVVRIEKTVELIASAVLGGALGFAASVFLRPMFPEPQLGCLIGAAAVAGLLLGSVVIRAASARTRSFATPFFDLSELEQPNPDDLLGCGDGRGVREDVIADPEQSSSTGNEPDQEPLMLEDVLATIGPESRVVRLFDRKAMPTPGELQSRIADHLGEKRFNGAHDASEALSEALAELRRSLR